MNRYFVERFQDIRDALPSASADTLNDLRQELVTLIDEIDTRMGEVGQSPRTSSTQANVRTLTPATNRP